MRISDPQRKPTRGWQAVRLEQQTHPPQARQRLQVPAQALWDRFSLPYLPLTEQAAALSLTAFFAVKDTIKPRWKTHDSHIDSAAGTEDELAFIPSPCDNPGTLEDTIRLVARSAKNIAAEDKRKLIDSLIQF